MWERSSSSRVQGPPASAPAAGTDASRPTSISRTGPRARIAALSRTFCSSRTLPGQEYFVSRSMLPRLQPSSRLPSFFERESRKNVTSSGMSARRSRSAGTRTGKTFNRYIRSARKVPSRTASSRSRLLAASTRTSTRTVRLPPAAAVDRPREELLARPGLAQQKHRRIGSRHTLDLAEHRQKRRTVADDLLEVALGPDLLLQVEVLRLQAVLQGIDLRQRLAQCLFGPGAPLNLFLHLLVEPGVFQRDRRLGREDPHHLDVLRGERVRSQVVLEIEQSREAPLVKDRHAENRARIRGGDIRIPEPQRIRRGVSDEHAFACPARKMDGGMAQIRP